MSARTAALAKQRPVTPALIMTLLFVARDTPASTDSDVSDPCQCNSSASTVTEPRMAWERDSGSPLPVAAIVDCRRTRVGSPSASNTRLSRSAVSSGTLSVTCEQQAAKSVVISGNVVVGTKITRQRHIDNRRCDEAW